MRSAIRKAQAQRRGIEGRLAVEIDAEMCAFYEQVIAQWTIEINNLKRSRSFRRTIRNVFATRLIGWSGVLLLVSVLRSWRWLAGKRS